MRPRLAVLISGSGTTLQNLLDRSRDGRFDADIVCVIASRDGIAGIEKARLTGLEAKLISRKTFDSLEAFSDAVFAEVDAHRVDLVVCGGWLSLLQIPPRWINRVVNIHPSLLPSFGGKGMYGLKVHQAIIDHGCRVSGCTVHLVNDQYDSGLILAQASCEVREDDTAHSLAARVFAIECEVYPRTILKVVSQRGDT